MRYLLAFLPALVCAGLMYGCMKMMSRSHGEDASLPADLESRVLELEQELEQLRAQSERANRRVEV